MDDKHPQIQSQALHSVSDYFKLFTEEELSVTFRALPEDEDMNVCLCMGMLLSRMDRTFEWTDDALTRV
jgi:hypothetical protein